jgi:hypothetical protein
MGMSRNKKKRNKPYTGADSTPAQPTVHRYTAAPRSPAGEWWQSHKRAVLLVSKIAGGIIVGGYLLYELIRMIF